MYHLVTIDYLGLGPVTVRQAMMAKILQDNGKVVYISTNWPLTIEEMADTQVQHSIHSFKETTEECLNAKLNCNKLEE